MRIGLNLRIVHVTGSRALRLTGVVVALGIALALVPLSLAQRAASNVTSEWPPELGAAFQVYCTGAYVETQRLCRAIMSETRDERLRREASALHALALMRMPARQDRLNGRVQLAQLAQEDPSLVERPECRLAVGIVESSLGETAAAIRDLTAAVEGFSKRQLYDRWAESCVALAEAWSRHNEWEVPLEHMGVHQPRDAVEARTVRRTQIKKLLEQVATRPGCEEAAQQIELILATNLIVTGDDVAQGVNILERLSQAPRATRPVAQACLMLGEHYEQQGRSGDALRLYRRVEATSLGELSERAAQAANKLSQPQIVIDVPQSSRPGQPLQIELRVRNLHAVELELRRVDMWEWLESRRGRFAEALLPTTGSVALARELDTHTEPSHAWWTSAALASPLCVTLEAGAYVVIAQGEGDGDDAQALTVKRLVLVSDLRAATIIGAQHALIWAALTTDHGNDESAPLSAAFWVHGSFVPLRPEFDGEVARLRLPAEARVMRDKHWVCLVRAGEHMALCRGVLPRSASTEPRDAAVALVTTPPEPVPGETLRVLGWVATHRGESGAKMAGETWQLDLVDTREDRRLSVMTEIGPTGTFRAALPIDSELANEHLSVIVRRDERVLENVRGRSRVHVARADRPRFEARCQTPTRLSTNATELRGEIQALYPWGVPLAGARVSYTARAVRLPIANAQDPSVASLPVSEYRRLDDDGKLSFAIPISAFGLEEGPLAIGLWTHVIGWDKRQVSTVTETLVGSQPVSLWLDHQPESPAALDPVRFRLAWFDPEERSTSERPTLEIRGDDVPAKTLRLYPSPDGLVSEPWRPSVAGQYEALAALPVENGEPVTVRRTVRVRPGTAAVDEASEPITCRAQYARVENAWGVSVSLRGRLRERLLVMVEAGDPLAATTLRQLGGDAEVWLPLDEDRPADAQVVLAVPGASGLRILDTVAVDPAENEALELTLRADLSAIAPGADVPVDVVCSQSAASSHDVVLLARLIDATTTGYVDWIPGQGAASSYNQLDELTVASSLDFSGGSDIEQTSRTLASPMTLSPDLYAELFEGVTLWADSRLVDADVTGLNVPLPAQPGRYRLIVTARSAAGWTTCGAITLDVREGLRLSADVPQVFTVGDRSLLAITIENPQAAPATSHLTIRPGTGLQLESLRAVESGENGEITFDESGATLALPPGERLRITGLAEASKTGPATATIELETGAVRQQIQRRYEVFPVKQEPAAVRNDALPPIRVKRTLHWLLTGAEVEPTPGDDQDRRTSFPKWTATTPVQPGERLTPGKWLLIRDEFVLSEALTDVVWAQRVPAACISPVSEPEGFQHLGRWKNKGLHRIVYTAESVPAGRQIQECAVIVVRPGAYRMPPPEIHVQGRSAVVEIEPTEIHVLVRGAASAGAP